MNITRLFTNTFTDSPTRLSERCFGRPERPKCVFIYYVLFHFLHALLQQLAALIIQFSTSTPSILSCFFFLTSFQVNRTDPIFCGNWISITQSWGSHIASVTVTLILKLKETDGFRWAVKRTFYTHSGLKRVSCVKWGKKKKREIYVNKRLRFF